METENDIVLPNGAGQMGHFYFSSDREAFQKKNYGDSEIGPTPLNPPTPTSDREKKCRDSCVEI